MSKKILLADDSITIQKVIELTFSDEDFEVVTVGNGRLAIERVQDVRPDLVLCDILMPEKDGYDVCDFIKKNPALSRTPVLLLTGAFEPFDQERATRVGCDGFLAKPFEPQTLIAKVKELLGRTAAPAAVAPSVSPPPAFAPAPSAPAVTAPAVTAPAAAPAPTPAPSAPAWTTHSTAPPAPAARDLEPIAFVPEPPPAYEAPSVPTPVLPFEEAGVSFFPEETLDQPAARKPTGSGDTSPVPTFPETPDFEEFRASNFDDVGSSPTITLTTPPASAPSPAPAPVAATAPAPAPRVAPAAEARPASAGRGFPALDEEDGPQTLLHVSAEEAATLRGEPSPPARVTPPPPAPAPVPAPPSRIPPRAPLWTQQTMEVSLETRARASMEAVQVENEPVFEEVFDTAAPLGRPAPVEPPKEPPAAFKPPAPAPAPPPAPAAASPAPASVPAAAAAPVAARVETPAPTAPPKPAPPPAPSPASASPSAASFAAALNLPGDRPAGRGPDEPTTLSVPGKEATAVRSSVPSAAAAGAEAAAVGAAGVSVPVDLVSQIAQRVVAQISEKVIREVAWEVIPDLAEVLIKKEIERLKAELQRT
jgi:CheY-like chemotaxis protein